MDKGKRPLRYTDAGDGAPSSSGPVGDPEDPADVPVLPRRQSRYHGTLAFWAFCCLFFPLLLMVAAVQMYVGDRLSEQSHRGLSDWIAGLTMERIAFEFGADTVTASADVAFDIQRAMASHSRLDRAIMGTAARLLGPLTFAADTVEFTWAKTTDKLTTGIVGQSDKANTGPQVAWKLPRTFDRSEEYSCNEEDSSRHLPASSGAPTGDTLLTVVPLNPVSVALNYGSLPGFHRASLEIQIDAQPALFDFIRDAYASSHIELGVALSGIRVRSALPLVSRILSRFSPDSAYHVIRQALPEERLNFTNMYQVLNYTLEEGAVGEMTANGKDPDSPSVEHVPFKAFVRLVNPLRALIDWLNWPTLRAYADSAYSLPFDVPVQVALEAGSVAGNAVVAPFVYKAQQGTADVRIVGTVDPSVSDAELSEFVRTYLAGKDNTLLVSYDKKSSLEVPKFVRNALVNVPVSFPGTTEEVDIFQDIEIKDVKIAMGAMLSPKGRWTDPIRKVWRRLQTMRRVGFEDRYLIDLLNVSPPPEPEEDRCSEETSDSEPIEIKMAEKISDVFEAREFMPCQCEDCQPFPASKRAVPFNIELSLSDEPDGDLLCSGTVTGYLDLPSDFKPIERYVSIDSVFPDLYVYEGPFDEIDEPSGDYPPEPMPLKAFGRLKPTEPVLCETTYRKFELEPGEWCERNYEDHPFISCHFENAPLRLFPERDDVFRRLLGKILFNGRATASVKGLSNATLALSVASARFTITDIPISGTFVAMRP